MKKEKDYRSFNEAPALMTLEQTAVLLGITYECAKARAQHGDLPGAFHSGRSWRVDKEVLIASFGTRPSAEKEQNVNVERAIRDLIDVLSKVSA